MVVAEDAVWNSYISSHKEAGQFRRRNFPYYDQLTSIYAKDRATEKGAQITDDIVEEIDAEGVAIAKNPEVGSNYHGYEDDVSLYEMDISDGSEQISISLTDAATLLGKNIRTVGLELSKSIASEVLIQGKSEMLIQESAQKLYLTLCEIKGLIEDEYFCTLSKIPDYPTQMLVFFSLPSFVRLE
ncbi:Chaperone DnaK [Gossypium australe]|uniref:Chaperone DnaK n=1 Tax=Gossypium australe TaxID=47621 RepID=A0A5B6W0D8_9ROSI|nr:Chaperone DnaK [Gossypium australe]